MDIFNVLTALGFLISAFNFGWDIKRYLDEKKKAEKDETHEPDK